MRKVAIVIRRILRALPRRNGATFSGPRVVRSGPQILLGKVRVEP